MNVKVVLAGAVIMLLTVFCGSGPDPTPTPESVPPNIHGPVNVKGDKGATIPVQCETEMGEVEIPGGSFTGEESFTIQCLTPEEQSDLDRAVEEATNQTGEVLGAIRLDPRGLKFNKDVIITIPLLRQVTEQIVTVYIYDETAEKLFDEILEASVDCTGWCAKAKVEHFTTFIAYEVTGVADQDRPEIANARRRPTADWVCLEETPQVTITSRVTDASDLASVEVEYWFNNDSPQTLNMEGSGDTYTAEIEDLQQGSLNYRVRATDVHDNSNTIDGIALTAFQCKGLEPHQDFAGFDLPNSGDSVGAYNLEACQQACVDNDQCMAFTFLPSDGSCWLKSGIPEPSNNTDLISGVVQPDESPPAIGDVDSSLTSSPVCIQNVSQINVSSVIQDESGVSRANLSYAFASFGGGGGEQSIEMQPDGDVFFASLDTSTPGQLSYFVEAWDIHENHAQSEQTQITIWDCEGLLFDTDLFGLDIQAAIYADNPQACRQSCSNRSDCAAFTYYPADGSCWLKYAEPEPTSDERFISGVVRPDQQGPSISSINYQDLNCAALVYAQVSDTAGVGNVELWHYSSGSWQSQPMSYNSSTGRYEATVFLTGTYLIRAFDVHGNSRDSGQFSVSFYCIT